MYRYSESTIQCHKTDHLGRRPYTITVLLSYGPFSLLFLHDEHRNCRKYMGPTFSMYRLYSPVWLCSSPGRHGRNNKNSKCQPRNIYNFYDFTAHISVTTPILVHVYRKKMRYSPTGHHHGQTIWNQNNGQPRR